LAFTSAGIAVGTPSSTRLLPPFSFSFSASSFLPLCAPSHQHPHRQKHAGGGKSAFCYTFQHIAHIERAFLEPIFA
jgi:hypothetical protein